MAYMTGKTKTYGKRPAIADRTLSPNASELESVRLDTVAIGARIKMSRETLGLTQDELARVAGSPSKSGLQSNEYGRTMPGGQMIGALVHAGINANWLLTGEGPMLLKDLGVACGDSRVPPALPVALALALGRAMKPGGWAPEGLKLEECEAIVAQALGSIQSSFPPEQQRLLLQSNGGLDAAVRIAYEVRALS